MKRIRKAAMLAAILAFSGAGQAQTAPSTRARVQLEDALTTTVRPRAHRASDPTEQLYAVGLDYTQESRLNDRQRDERRHKARAQKAQTRFGE
jgi:hypothetical protein